ncbi:MAG: hypothetical protein OCD00_12780 [Colwellia sp.]
MIKNASKHVILLLVCFLFSCHSSSEKNNDAQQKWQVVTVKYFSFEGGFFGLVSKNGVKLLPMNLKKNYKIDGTILKVIGHVDNDIMTIQQWGTPFNITAVELVKIGKNK